MARKKSSSAATNNATPQYFLYDALLNMIYGGKFNPSKTPQINVMDFSSTMTAVPVGAAPGVFQVSYHGTQEEFGVRAEPSIKSEERSKPRPALTIKIPSAPDDIDSSLPTDSAQSPLVTPQAEIAKGCLSARNKRLIAASALGITGFVYASSYGVVGLCNLLSKRGVGNKEIMDAIGNLKSPLLNSAHYFFENTLKGNAIATGFMAIVPVVILSCAAAYLVMMKDKDSDKNAGKAA